MGDKLRILESQGYWVDQAAKDCWVWGYPDDRGLGLAGVTTKAEAIDEAWAHLVEFNPMFRHTALGQVVRKELEALDLDEGRTVVVFRGVDGGRYVRAAKLFHDNYERLTA